MSVNDQSEQLRKATIFKELHERAGMLVLPNPWDAGSARILTGLGFEALATTSAGLAFSLGKPDGLCRVTREETITNARSIATSTILPVSADLENGFGDDPESCAETILLAADAGLVGGSIEDATGRPEMPMYSLQQSVERVKAAVQAARSLSLPFMICARAENRITDANDLKDTLRRLEAYAAAGADVLFAPGLAKKEDVELAVRTVAPRPLNVVIGSQHASLSLRELESWGVRRISLGSSLARAAYGAFMRAAGDMRSAGTFGYIDGLINYSTFNEMFNREIGIQA